MSRNESKNGEENIVAVNGTKEERKDKSDGLSEEEKEERIKELQKLGYIKVEDRENPYDVPPGKLASGLRLYGARLFDIDLFEYDTPFHRIETLRKLPIRDDDVIIAAYAKSGTHWLWEVASMLVRKTTNYEERVKEFNMLELCDFDVLSQDPSPRILNSHFWVPHLPQEILTKKTKIIHIVRNPKSVLVSYFFHISSTYPEKKFTLDSLMRTLIDNNWHTENQLQYLRHMSEFQKAHPDHPVKTIYYEHMKKNPVETTRELADFLGTPNTEEFYQQVVEACGFEKMKQVDVNKKKPDNFDEEEGTSGVQFYRKGTIEDWKNHLTVAQNEMMDEFIAKFVEKYDLDYQFIYA